MNKNLRFLQSLLVVLFGCGSETQKEYLDYRSPEAPVSFFPLYKKRMCQKGLSTFDNIDYQAWNGSELESRRFTQSWSSANGIHSKLVSEVTFGLIERYLVDPSCKTSRSVSEILSRQCITSRKVIEYPTSIKICQERRYPDSSMESVALSILGSIDQVERFWEELDIKELVLPPLKISVLPLTQFDVIIDDDFLYLTDNASWTPPADHDSLAEISIYPSKESSQTSLWRITWITAHEYGHHVFYSMQSDNVRASFRNQTSHQQMLNSNNVSTTYEQEMQLISINEGFADLFAHYVHHNNSEQLLAIGCTMRERDPANSKLNNQQYKSFRNKMALNYDDRDTCHRTNMNDVHTIGSIIAYYLDRHLILAGYSDNVVKARLIINVFWDFLKKLNNDFTEETDIRRLFTNTMNKSLREDVGEFNEHQIELYNRVFGKKYYEF